MAFLLPPLPEPHADQANGCLRDARLLAGHQIVDPGPIARHAGPGTFDVPESARVLLDELTLRGDIEHAAHTLDRWYAAGAQMPTVVLPPGRSTEELDHMLEALST